MTIEDKEKKEILDALEDIKKTLDELYKGNPDTNRKGFVFALEDRIENVEDRLSDIKILDKETINAISKIATVMNTWKFVLGAIFAFVITLGSFAVAAITVYNFLKGV